MKQLLKTKWAKFKEGDRSKQPVGYDRTCHQFPSPVSVYGDKIWVVNSYGLDSNSSSIIALYEHIGKKLPPSVSVSFKSKGRQ